MKTKLIFYFILCILISNKAFSSHEKKKSLFHNPFLTPEEEMKALGIKAPAKIKKKEAVSLKGLKLSGIIYGERKIAIINSDFYTEGDTVGGFKIKEIKPLSIILVRDDKERELKLKHILACDIPELKGSKEEETETGSGISGGHILGEDAIKELRERQRRLQKIFGRGSR